MKIVGISRIRNESLIIRNTLDHVSQMVDEIILYDDCSTDDTVSICSQVSKVSDIIRGEKWESNPRQREREEGRPRQLLYERAKLSDADWVYYFDADEYATFDFVDFASSVYHFRLFDFYITEKDVNDDYLTRKYMGPEYRDIPMLFNVKENPKLFFNQRIPRNIAKSVLGGYVKHFGKAISVDHFDETCQYYINHRWNGINESLLNRWKGRIGKAIHTKSDFDNELIEWNDRFNEQKIRKL